MLENKKARARLSILERLRNQGAPVSPFPGEVTAEDNLDTAMAGEEDATGASSLDQLTASLLPVTKKKLRKQEL